MEIIRTNVDENDKVEVYRLVKSSSTMVQDAPANLSVQVVKWMLYNDPKTDKNGTIKDNKVLSFIDPAGIKYSTISPTFIKEFIDIVDLMGETPFAVILMQGTTKAGKSFVTCEMDCDYKG